MQSASAPQDPNEKSLKIGYFLWLAAIGAIVYAYVFATNKSDMKNTTLDPTMLDETTGKPMINTGHRVITLLPLVWLYTFLTKGFTLFTNNNAMSMNMITVILLIVLLTLTGFGLVIASVGATTSTKPFLAGFFEGNERIGFIAANIALTAIPILLGCVKVMNLFNNNTNNTINILFAKATQIIYNLWFPIMMMYYFIKTGATDWFRIVAGVSIGVSIVYNLYNLYSPNTSPQTSWMAAWVESFKNFIETSPIISYFKFVENNDLNDVAKRVLIFALLCYVAYLMISVYNFKNKLVPCVSTHFASCFWNPNFKQSDGAKTYYNPETNTPYINALFYTLIISICANILNFGINLFSLYKRINNTLFDGKDVVPEVDISFEKFKTFMQMIVFPFYWIFKLFVQHPLITIVAFIAFAAIGLLLYRSSFDLTEFIEGQRGTVITLFTLFIASLVMFGVYTANNKGPSGPINKGPSGPGSPGSSGTSGTYSEFILRPMMFIAVAACIIGIISFFLTSQSRIVTMANLLQYAITMMIYIVGIAIVISLARTMFSTSRKMGESMFQTSPDSNWVINVLKLIGNMLFCLPCLMLDTVDMLKEQYGLTTRPYLILLAVEAAFILAGLFLPSLVAKTINHKGVQIVSAPISMTTQTVVSKYNIQFVESKGVVSSVSGPNPLPPLPSTSPTSTPTPTPTMNPTDIKLHNYSYGLSAWFYIHPQPPNAYDETRSFNVFDLKDADIGPRVSYTPKTNTLTVAIGSSATIPSITDVPLQRWNNIVINSDNGIIDIFMNGKLVYTGTHLPKGTPHSPVHHAVIGGVVKDGGDYKYAVEGANVHGEICNMVLNREPFTNAEIAWFYETNKVLNPPVVGVNPDPLNQGDSASYLASQSVSNVIVDNESNVDKTPNNPLSFSTHGATVYGFLGAFFGAIFGWLFNRNDGVEPVKGLLMGTVVFGLIGALLGALFSTDGTVANIMKTIANVFVNTF